MFTTEKIEGIIANLKRIGVTLKQVSEELDYRDKSAENCKWDSVLYEYSTAELEIVEVGWQSVEV